MNVHGEVLLVLMNMFIFVKNQNHHFYFQEHSPKIVEAEIVYTRSLEDQTIEKKTVSMGRDFTEK